MKLILPLLFNRLKKLPCRFYNHNNFNFNKISNLKLFKVIENLDSFNNLKANIDNINFNLYDKNDWNSVFQLAHFGWMSLFNPCIIREDFIIETANVIYNPFSGMQLLNFKIGFIPEELRYLGIDIYQGKSCIEHINKYLSIKIDFNKDNWKDNNLMFLQMIPKKYHHCEFNNSCEYLYKPRIKIWIKNAMHYL